MPKIICYLEVTISIYDRQVLGAWLAQVMVREILDLGVLS